MGRGASQTPILVQYAAPRGILTASQLPRRAPDFSLSGKCSTGGGAEVASDALESARSKSLSPSLRGEDTAPAPGASWELKSYRSANYQLGAVKRLQFPKCLVGNTAPLRAEGGLFTERDYALNLSSSRRRSASRLAPRRPDSPCSCDSASPQDAGGATCHDRSWISRRPASVGEPLAACAGWPCSLPRKP